MDDDGTGHTTPTVAPAAPRPAASAAELRAEIERTRVELGETFAALPFTRWDVLPVRRPKKSRTFPAMRSRAPSALSRLELFMVVSSSLVGSRSFSPSGAAVTVPGRSAP